MTGGRTRPAAAMVTRMLPLMAASGFPCSLVLGTKSTVSCRLIT
jgi:hypothetical protein